MLDKLLFSFEHYDVFYAFRLINKEFGLFLSENELSKYKEKFCTTQTSQKRTG